MTPTETAIIDCLKETRMSSMAFARGWAHCALRSDFKQKTFLDAWRGLIQRKVLLRIGDTMVYVLNQEHADGSQETGK